MTPTRRLSILTFTFLVVGAALGGILGARALADPQRADDQLWRFGRIVSLIEDQYVGKLDSKHLVEDAIQGMLHTLDPHSNYLNRDAFSEMRDEQRGHVLRARDPDHEARPGQAADHHRADRRHAGAPAGLQPGDVIAKIEGQETIELTGPGGGAKLKGEKGTKVTITIQRPGEAEPFDVTIVRDEIPTTACRVAFMLQPGRRARSASRTSPRRRPSELDDALRSCRAQGMTQLILDLRGNPGGLLDQAVQVSERFIPEGKLVVYTRGPHRRLRPGLLAQERGRSRRLPLGRARRSQLGLGQRDRLRRDPGPRPRPRRRRDDVRQGARPARDPAAATAARWPSRRPSTTRRPAG